jgi:hypothetical protein
VSMRQVDRHADSAELLFLGRDYPQGYTYFRDRLHAAFWKQRDMVDSEQIQQGVKRAEFVKKEIEALYVLAPTHHVIDFLGTT